MLCLLLSLSSANNEKMADFNPFTASFISSPDSNSRSNSPKTNWQPYLPDFLSISPPSRKIEQTVETPLVVPQPPNTDFLYTYLAYQAAAAAIAAAASNPPVQQSCVTQQQNISIHKSSPTSSETIYPWMRDAKRTFQQQTTSLVQQHQQSGGHYTSLVLTPSDSNHHLASPLSPQPTPPISLSPGKNINRPFLTIFFYNILSFFTGGQNERKEEATVMLGNTKKKY